MTTAFFQAPAVVVCATILKSKLLGSVLLALMVMMAQLPKPDNYGIGSPY
jgi:hypothetical protein